MERLVRHSPQVLEDRFSTPAVGGQVCATGLLRAELYDFRTVLQTPMVRFPGDDNKRAATPNALLHKGPGKCHRGQSALFVEPAIPFPEVGAVVGQEFHSGELIP